MDPKAGYSKAVMAQRIGSAQGKSGAKVTATHATKTRTERDEAFLDGSGTCADIFILLREPKEPNLAIKRFPGYDDHGKHSLNYSNEGIPEWILRDLLLLQFQHPCLWPALRVERHEQPEATNGLPVFDLVMPLAVGDVRKVCWPSAADISLGFTPVIAERCCQNRLWQLDSLYRITAAIAFLHEHGILHLDIKAENIFLANANPPAANDTVPPPGWERQLQAKLGDLGLSLFLHSPTVSWPEDSEHGRLRPEFAPPDKEDPSIYSTADDIWLLGRFYVDLMTSRKTYPFDFDTKSLLDPKDPCWTNGLSCEAVWQDLGPWAPLLRRMLSAKESDRPKASQILADPIWKDKSVVGTWTIPALEPGKEVTHPCPPKQANPETVNIIENLCITYGVQVVTLFLAQEIALRLPKPTTAQTFAAFLLASKLHEVHPPTLSDLSLESQQYVTEEIAAHDILDAEWQIIDVMKGQIYPPTLYYGSKTDIIARYGTLVTAEGAKLPRNRDQKVTEKWLISEFFDEPEEEPAPKVAPAPAKAPAKAAGAKTSK